MSITIDLCKRDSKGNKIPGRSTLSAINGKQLAKRFFEITEPKEKKKTK